MMLVQVMQCGQRQRQQEASGAHWVRALPADALRKAGNLQKAHQPSLESMLAAQAGAGKCICSPDKVRKVPLPICVLSVNMII